MTYRIWLGICLLSGVLGAFLVYKLRAPEIKESVRETTKIVTVTKVVKQSDGTTISETTTTEDKKTDETKQQPLLQPNTKKWLVSGTYNTDKVYGINIQKNVLANIYVGASANTSGTLGVSVGLSF